MGVLLLDVAAAQGQLEPLPRMAAARVDPVIARPAEWRKPFTVAGPYGALFGEQSGMFEAWLWPVKVLSHFSIEANLEDYPVPIELAPLAAEIEVTPAETIVTYSHAAFTVRQRMLAPREADPGAVVLFEIDSIKPIALTFRFDPEMLRMWPAANSSRPSAEWVKRGQSGYYVLHTDDPSFSAAVAMPRAQPGILAPYQERPQTHPVELKLRVDPKKDGGLSFPLLLSLGNENTDYAARLAKMNGGVSRLVSDRQAYAAHFFDKRLTVETPDPRLDQAIRWAEVAIDQGRVKWGEETGLVAGYSESADSARPGFGWFFGRDSLWTSYAINSYGDFGLTRDVLQFLMRRQRADGKIMHEFSQTAGLVDWKSLPYFYASADATPLFVMAMADYVSVSGDVGFLQASWEAVRKAYAFTRAHDSDGDGIYENTEGTGWVESWPAGMPHQEIYLAALDQQSADAMSRLATLEHDSALADSAGRQAAKIRSAIESEYYEKDARFYAFSRSAGGGLDGTATIYPAVAWWNGTLALENAGGMLTRWASPEFSTDWGTRDISSASAFYDPISYHQGSVWPLFTGWASLAEYRGGRALAAYSHLMQNADLSWAQDPGAVTELLSGEFFQPLGRSSSHQIWSSAMVLTPALRGLFGLDWDAPHSTLRLSPHLPASWNYARLRNVPLGSQLLDLDLQREAGQLRIRAHSAAPSAVCLVPQAAPRDVACQAPVAATHELSIPLPEVELEMPHGLPLPGAATAQLKAISEQRAAGSYTVEFEAPGGAQFDLPVRLNRRGVRVEGAEIVQPHLRLHFPEGEGYRRLNVKFTW